MPNKFHLYIIYNSLAELVGHAEHVDQYGNIPANLIVALGLRHETMQDAGVKLSILVWVGISEELRAWKHPTSWGTSSKSSRGPVKIVAPVLWDVIVWLILENEGAFKLF